MTTENIEGSSNIDELLQELGRLAKAAESRAEEVSKKAKGIETRRENARRGTRVVERKLNDDAEELAEEARQLAWILGTDNGDDVHERVRELPPVQEEPPAPPVAPPTPPAGGGLIDTPRTPRREPTTTPQPTVAHVIDVRNWTVWAWVGAFLGAVIALLIAVFTGHPLAHHSAKGVGAGLIMATWYVALVGFGFFGGGAAGSAIESD